MVANQERGNLVTIVVDPATQQQAKLTAGRSPGLVPSHREAKIGAFRQMVTTRVLTGCLTVVHNQLEDCKAVLVIVAAGILEF